MILRTTAVLAALTCILAMGDGSKNMTLNPLTPQEKRVILDKGTERPFTGEYDKFFEKGTYVCKQCGAPLYRSEAKFDSGCGWPSFDDEIPGAVKRTPDADGWRTEISCARCGAHLGHVFLGEGLTPKDTRHCVNSISLKFIPDSVKADQLVSTGAKADPPVAPKTEKAIFAGGCFWGMQYEFERQKGVVSSRVGYTGGRTDHPTYREVCSHSTGHYEALEITYDPTKTDYETLAKYFFEIHDPTQANGQGPDIGEQYLSMVFYLNEAQKATAEKLIQTLKDKGYKVATQVRPATTFWPAEDYHQHYYDKSGGTPYCHRYTKRF